MAISIPGSGSRPFPGRDDDAVFAEWNKQKTRREGRVFVVR